MFSSFLIETIDVIKHLKLDNEKGTFKHIPGLCHADQIINRKKALQFDNHISITKRISFNFDVDEAAILSTVKLPNVILPEFYLFRIYYGSSWIGVRIGKTISIDYFHDELSILSFPSNLHDGKWHRIGVGIKHEKVYLYVDCELVDTQALENTFKMSPDKNSKVDFGISFADKDSGFRVSYFLSCYTVFCCFAEQVAKKKKIYYPLMRNYTFYSTDDRKTPILSLQ